MKNLLLSCLFLFVTWNISAQPFFLFNDFTSKEFAPLEETWERNYTLKMDSLYWGNVISVFYLHSVMNLSEDADFQPDENDPDECFGWGGCFANTGSTGFGDMIFSPVPFAYDFYTLSGDTLRLDFLADSSVFYQNESELFAMIYESETEQMVFGSMEMVQSYRIGHYNTDGAELLTPLHGSAITVGENTGLIDFFQVDEFPQVEMPLTLIGDANHGESLTLLTGEMIYDFQVGDTIQYKISYFESEPFGPNPIEEVSYLNRIFLNRMEEADTLRYTVVHQSFDQGELNFEEWTEELAYARFDTLASMPFYRRKDAGLNAYGSFQEFLFQRDFCGDVRIGFGGLSSPFARCEEHDAWCGFDTNGPPPITSYEYVPGLGQYLHEVDRNGFGTFTSWREATEVVFFSKGESSCGQEAILSSRDQDHPRIAFTVFPNPTDDMIKIRISSEVESQLSGLTVLDMSGRTVVAYPWKGANGTFDIAGLAAGIYLLQVTSADGILGTERFVVE
ncbi:T9SS type A sorting domain-containing protein [Cryomorphaceae bacterium 1068]|nr:T9SS type A sorting domain-containing protein [Cryomorphaceae bacterium 1068]